jgi:hypothetical protein
MRLRKLTKWVAGGSLLALVVGLNADPTHGQFPGRGDRGGPPGGFSRGGFDADSSFNKMLQATGATGGDVVDYSRLSPEYRERTNRFLQMMNQPALPTSGTVTRDQYKQQFAQRTEAMKSRFGGGPPGGATMMSAPGSGDKPVIQMSVGPGGAPGQPSVAPQTPGAPSPWGGTPPQYGTPPGGFNPAAMSDEQIAGMMRRYDRDGDGRISAEEGQRSDRLRDGFSRYDANRDGFLDTNEYKGYLVERMSNDQNRGGDRGGDRGRDRGSFGGGPPGYDPNNQQPPQWGGGPPGGWGGNGGGWDRGRDQEQEQEQRPVVYRYGHLPKDLPSWFNGLDEDKDGQVGLYEWRKGGKTTTEYLTMDLNQDGLLTAEEYLRFKKDGTGGRSTESAASMFGGDRGNRGGGPPGRGGDRGNRGNESSSPREEKPREEKQEERRSNGGGGGNPFRR